MKKLTILVVTIILLSLCNTANALMLDWSSVTLSGTFPNFTFSHSTLGNVSLTYSSDTESFGIGNNFPVPTLLIGNTGGESLIMSWSNPVINFDMDIWDIDAISGTTGEHMTFVTAAIPTIDTLHPSDIWNPAILTLSSDGTSNPNNSSGNFTIMNFANPSGFNAIQFDWAVGGAGIPGIGEIRNIQVQSEGVPEPSTLLLLGGGLIGVTAFRKMFKK